MPEQRALQVTRHRAAIGKCPDRVKEAHYDSRPPALALPNSVGAFAPGALGGFHTMWVKPAGWLRPYRVHWRSRRTRASARVKAFRPYACAYQDEETRDGLGLLENFYASSHNEETGGKTVGPTVMALSRVRGGICFTAGTAFESSTLYFSDSVL